MRVVRVVQPAMLRLDSQAMLGKTVVVLPTLVYGIATDARGILPAQHAGARSGVTRCVAGTMEAVLVRNADRMMTVATIMADGVQLSFADGCKGMIPYSDIDDIDDATDLSGLELPNPYAMILNTVNGERIDIPWDFARHYCDESYRPTVEAIAMRGRRALGERLRALRDSAGLTQDELARAANIGRLTLVRIENGERTPKVKTFTAIADVLGKRVTDLLVEPESLL